MNVKDVRGCFAPSYPAAPYLSFYPTHLFLHLEELRTNIHRRQVLHFAHFVGCAYHGNRQNAEVGQLIHLKTISP